MTEEPMELPEAMSLPSLARSVALMALSKRSIAEQMRVEANKLDGEADTLDTAARALQYEGSPAEPDTRTDAHNLQQGGPMIPLQRAGLQKVPKWCHAPAGKAILCPVCAAVSHVYHFGWTALQCQFCNADVKKYDWYLAPAATPEE